MDDVKTPTTSAPTTPGAASPAKAAAMRRSGRQGLLRTALLVDAGVTGANGLIYLVATVWLSGVLGYRDGLLRGVGVFLLVYAVVIAAVSRTRAIPAVGAWFAVVMNIAWTVVSLASAAGMATALSGVSALGRVWTVLQALVVLAFGVAQWLGWRRAGADRD